MLTVYRVDLLETLLCKGGVNFFAPMHGGHGPPSDCLANDVFWQRPQAHDQTLGLRHHLS
jgi:hypothetical protein